MSSPTPKVEQAENREPLFGQWIGKFEGDSFVFPGSATFSIEYDRPDRGFACIDQGKQLHGSRKDFALQQKGNRFSGHSTSTIAFDWKTNEIITVEESVGRQKSQGMGDFFYLTELEIHDGFIDQQTLTCKWSGSHLGKKITGKFEGRKLSQTEPSPYDQLMSWERLKGFVAGLIRDRREFVFRGQSSNKYRLNTSFHRERQYDLLRFESEACDHLTGM